MSKWEEEKAERNRRSLSRLTKALPLLFCLGRSARPFIPTERAPTTNPIPNASA